MHFLCSAGLRSQVWHLSWVWPEAESLCSCLGFAAFFPPYRRPSPQARVCSVLPCPPDLSHQGQATSPSRVCPPRRRVSTGGHRLAGSILMTWVSLKELLLLLDRSLSLLTISAGAFRDHVEEGAIHQKRLSSGWPCGCRGTWGLHVL